MIKREHVMTNPRLAGLVKRYHTWPVTREQNVAEHSWQMMRIHHAIWPEPLTTKDVLLYIMFHDVAELKTGDLPYPVKIKYPKLRPIIDNIEEDSLRQMDLWLPALTDVEKKRIKICDMLEMWEFCREEMARGNQFAEILVADCAEHARTVAREIGEWFAVDVYMRQMQEKLCGS